MLFIAFVLPFILALGIIFVYLWRIKYRQAARYPLLFRIFYGLVILGSISITTLRLTGALNLGWSFAAPWLLTTTLGSVVIIGSMIVDVIRPIRSVYMAYLVPLFAILIAGIDAVKPGDGGVIALLFIFVASALWMYVVRMAGNKLIGIQRRISLTGLHLVPFMVLAGWLAYAGQQSVLLSSVNMNMPAGRMIAMPHKHGAIKEVTDLRGPESAAHIKKFDIEAAESRITLSSGETADAWVYRTANAPSMPVLRVKQGDLVEASLTNHLSVPVTIHWHGVDVPNGEDGVAGVTQDAVKPGKRFTYRFIAKDAGSYWFHSHQDANVQVAKGLFGALIVEPAGSTTMSSSSADIPVFTHTWQNEGTKRLALGTNDDIENKTLAPGTPVRLRLINTDNNPCQFQIVGASYKVISLDGSDVSEPRSLDGQTIQVPSGGRADVNFTMPDAAVGLFPMKGSKPERAALFMSPDGAGRPKAPAKNAEIFDMATYGKAVANAIPPSAKFDKTYKLTLDNSFRFFNGQLRFTFPVNGRLFPDTPMVTVHEGDLVKVTFKNRSYQTHPMHLHGHHFTVLEHNGQAAPSRPILDTVDVAPGESWTIAFRADNPGLWMSHCHNLTHASVGMDLMVMYDDVMTPFTINWNHGNKPE